MQNTRREVGRRSPRNDGTELQQEFRIDDLSDVAGALSAPGTVADVRKRIVQMAAVPDAGCDAGLFVVENEQVVTAACTSPYIFSLDRSQFETDEGPCLDAISDRRTYFVDDLTIDEQWPRFRIRAVAAGVRSVLSIPLAVQDLSVLAIYSTRPRTFDDVVRTRASHFATLAAIALDMVGERAESSHD